MKEESSLHRRADISQRQASIHAMEEIIARNSLGRGDGDEVDSDISASEALDSTREENESSKREEVSIARTETKVVRSLKLIMLGILLFSSIGVATAVYFYTRNSEQQQFETAFQENSRKVLEVGRTVSATFTSHAYSHVAHRALFQLVHVLLGYGTFPRTNSGSNRRLHSIACIQREELEPNVPLCCLR
jgi:hypothetical protein